MRETSRLRKLALSILVSGSFLAACGGDPGEDSGLVGKAMRVLPMAAAESPSGDAPRSGGHGHP